MEKQEYIVEGFSFQDEEQAKQAKKEVAGVNYLRGKIDMDHPELVLQIYNKTIREGVFKTPVGFSYLRELQEYLYGVPYIMDEDVLPIPVSAPDMVQAQRTERNMQKNGAEKKKLVVHEKNIDFKKRYKTMFFLCVLFLIMIVSMFAITLTSNSPTILNYENEIINRYEGWEQELNEREQALKEKEREIEEK